MYPELLDNYFTKLDEYDCVITCQKITGELGNYDYDILSRDSFYISQSPEAFDFKLITSCFSPGFHSTELANQLPENTKRYLNFDFNFNLKITYDTDLICAEALINYFSDKKNTYPINL